MSRLALTSSLSNKVKLPISQYKHQLSPNATGLTIEYGFKGEQYRYEVPVTHTSCNYGGYRYWWRCPNCSKRVGVLYCAGVFVCRQCIGLHYACQLEQPIDKVFRKIEKLRHRLGWQAGIAYGNQGRPKGMHFTTYWRLVDEHNRLVDKVIPMQFEALKMPMPEHLKGKLT